MKARTFIIGLAVLAGAGAGVAHLTGAMPAWQKPAQSAVTAAPPKTSAPAVTVVRVAPAAFVETVALAGSLIAREEILVAAEIEGLRVVEVLAEEGDRVRKGQVLARLVSDTLDAQLAQNDAALARSAAAIAQARSAITQAEAALEEARNAFTRARTLKQSGYTPEATYDQREAAARTADARLVAARDGLKVAEAERAQIEAQRRELTWKRGKTEIAAPADGIISRRNARIGSAASMAAAEPMFRLIAGGDIELDAEVPETQIARLKTGQQATITAPGMGEVKATVRLISPEVDRTTRLGRVRLAIGDRPGLRVGSFARAIVTTAEGKGLAVPTSAVLFAPEGAVVQTVAGDRVVTKRIKTGLASGDIIEVKEGLVEGELVVARAGTFVRDGDTVRPVPVTGGKQ